MRKKRFPVSLTELKDRLRQSIKLDFEVERMEPLFATEEDYQAFHDRQAAIRYPQEIWNLIRGTAIWALTPAAPPPRRPLWEKTAAFFILSTATITEAP